MKQNIVINFINKHAMIFNKDKKTNNKFLPTTSTLFYLKNSSNNMNNPSKFGFNYREFTVITVLQSCSFLFKSIKNKNRLNHHTNKFTKILTKLRHCSSNEWIYRVCLQDRLHNAYYVQTTAFILQLRTKDES